MSEPVPPATAPVRPGDELDWPALQHRLAEVLGLPAEPMVVSQFTAGRANLTYLVQAGDQRWVVRRPPRGTLAPGSHDMAREYRVLSRLWTAYPRAPRAVYFTDDAEVIGAPFLVTEFRSGLVVSDTVPSVLADLPDVERRLDLALIDAAADLHVVDPAAVDLVDLGRPDGFAARQVRGWADRWTRASATAGDPLMDEVATMLAARIPNSPRPAIVHNDLKLDNCQFQPDDPDTVSSVFDWDMATLGDPLFDLGLLLVSMHAHPTWTITDDEAVAHYSARSGIDVTSIDWYVAFANWRMAVVLRQLVNRFLAGQSTDARLGALADAIPECAERAHGLLAGG